MLTAEHAKGIRVGVNGIYVETTDSAALTTMTPAGDSMEGPNPEAVLESLKRSRRLCGYSLSLAGITLLIGALGLGEIAFPWLKDVKLTPDRFCLLAVAISLGLLTMANLFFSDALKGAKYLQDRKSAMSVGSFPWALSRFSGGGVLNRVASLTVRFVMSFHVLFYMLFLGKWNVFDLTSLLGAINMAVLVTLLLGVSIWTFVLSQRFQKPILFDSRTEAKRMEQSQQMARAIDELSEIKKAVSALVSALAPKQDEESQADGPINGSSASQGDASEPDGLK